MAQVIAALQQAGTIDGKPGNVFDPNGTITRAEMAKIMDVYTDIDRIPVHDVR
ncbi:MAG: S-layer homology domain-containing protein [Clostridiales Family XIII bacterium]|jgi:hypothetical protein|nr:S-layer homology domain-containing protein [Clostridiales Family XIII bacterium]